MPAQKKITKTNTKKPPKKLSNKSILFIILIILAGVVPASWIAYSNYKDKQRFVNAQQSINTLYKEITTKTGSPTDSQSIQSCRRASTKYGDGPMSCSVTTVFYYTSQSDTEADKKVSISEVALSQNGAFKNIGHPSGLRASFDNSENTQSNINKVTSFVENKSKTGCYIDYDREPPYKSKFYQEKQTSQENLYLEITCSDVVSHAVYPETN